MVRILVAEMVWNDDINERLEKDNDFRTMSFSIFFYIGSGGGDAYDAYDDDDEHAHSAP